MLFSKISGLWRDDKHIYISAEYHNIKFHIHEIESVQIVDSDNLVRSADDMPIKNARILFLLKSGRKRICWVRKLTKRKYKYLTNLLETE